MPPFITCLLSYVILVSGCAGPGKTIHKLTPTNISSLHLIGKYEIPYNLAYNNTTVGGLSGIDYDAKNNVYYLVSDDRSAINPARFYTAKIFITPTGIDSVAFINVQSLLRPNGTVYPNNKQDPFHTPDPEDMRYNALTKQLVWTSEGERIVNAKDTIIENPSIIVISTDGKYIDSFPLPSQLIMHTNDQGPRQNGVLEGLSFADNFKTLYVNVEEPLYEDGQRADTADNNPFIRIFRFNTADKKNTAQYGYKLDPVAYPAQPSTAFKINGIPDILSLGNNKLLVIERSFSSGRLNCTIKVFLADLNNATDISSIFSLKGNTSFQPVSKKLLLNMDALNIYIDNIEGVTVGPMLPNGHKTLIFIADNNFSSAEKAQLLLFEVME